MKYLKKFNESQDRFQALEKVKNWVIENMKYSDEDILYYFSEFTDEFEWEWQINQLKEIESKYLPKNLYYEFMFESTPKKLISIEDYCNFTKELEKFRVCFHQFKNLEEGISDLQYYIHNNDTNKSITVTFMKEIPEHVYDDLEKTNLFKRGDVIKFDGGSPIKGIFLVLEDCKSDRVKALQIGSIALDRINLIFNRNDGIIFINADYHLHLNEEESKCLDESIRSGRYDEYLDTILDKTGIDLKIRNKKPLNF